MKTETKNKVSRFQIGETVYNSISQKNEVISGAPQWNGLTYMYSFEGSEMRAGEMYLSTPKQETEKLFFTDGYYKYKKAHDDLNEAFHKQVELYSNEVLKNEKLKAINDSLLNALKIYMEAEKQYHGMLPVVLRPVTKAIQEAIKKAEQ